MDKKALKSIILKLRNEGNTFQNIAIILKNKYDIEMSRQAVHGMYKRAVASNMNDIEMILATNDIINYSIIGLKANEIQQLIKKEYNIELSLKNIMEKSLSNEKYRKTVYKEKIDKLKSLLIDKETTYDITDIRKLLGYKSEPMRDTALDQLLYDYILLEIKNNTISLLAKIINLTNNKLLVKDITKRINISISNKDIEREYKYQ